jgi:glycerophosphoryl diester phosphodiesterase
VLCAYDLSAKEPSSIKPAEARAEVLGTGAKICILPTAVASQKNTEILNTLGVSVWYEASKNDKVELFGLVTSGANGIISTDRALLEQVISSPIFKVNSIIRPVGIIGHRGTPALAPENTLSGSILAAANGANIIENDIYLTTDDIIVVMHDKTIDRTTNGTGNVEDFSYAELCKFNVDCAPTTSESSYGKITDPQPIPTLEEYFAALRDTDTFMFIEVKSAKHEKLALELKRLIDKYDIADQCGVIAFDQGAVKAIRKAIPEISVGYLCSDSALETICGNISRLESSYNPSHSAVTPSLLRDLADRGIFTWPWTIRDSTSFDKFFLMGVAGITTDNSYLAKNYVKRISAAKESYTVTVGTAIDLSIIAETYGALSTKDLSNRTYDTNAADMLIIDGNDSLVYVNGRLMAAEAGEATVIFRLAFKLNNGQTAFVYSEPVTVNALAKTDDNDGSTDNNGGSDNNGGTDNNGNG